MNPLFAKQANATQNSEEQQVEHPEYTVQRKFFSNIRTLH